MDVAAVLLLGIAKADGDITSDQKRELLAMFQGEFNISRDEASDLLLASSYLIRDEIYLVDHLDKILARNAPRFEPEVVTFLLAMMRRVAILGGSVDSEQQKLIDSTERFFGEREGRGQVGLSALRSRLAICSRLASHRGPIIASLAGISSLEQWHWTA
jgi:hypothetical protein